MKTANNEVRSEDKQVSSVCFECEDLLLIRKGDGQRKPLVFSLIKGQDSLLITRDAKDPTESEEHERKTCLGCELFEIRSCEITGEFLDGMAEEMALVVDDPEVSLRSRDLCDLLFGSPNQWF